MGHSRTTHPCNGYLGHLFVNYGCQDTAGEPSVASNRLSEGNERWGASPSQWSLSKPSYYPHHIESSSNQQMKEASLWKTDIATAAQIAQPDSL